MRDRAQRGFTLIEILVAVVVFGLGVLGVAALSATSQKSSLKAYHAMLATWKAHEMMESIRANQGYARDTTTNYLHGPTDGAPSEPKNCIYSYGVSPDTDCGPADMAADDLYAWIASLDGYLPSATGSVSASGSSFTVTVFWDAGNADQRCDSSGYDAVSSACQSLTFEL